MVTTLQFREIVHTAPWNCNHFFYSGDSVEKKAKGSSAKPIEYVDMKPQSNDDENFASAVTDAAASQHV